MTLLAPGLNSEELFVEILEKISRSSKRTLPGQRKRYRRVYDTTRLLLQAAVILLVTGTGIWFALQQSSQDRFQRVALLEPYQFETAAGQQLDIRLRDGSRVRLNELSELIVPSDFSSGDRNVELHGEAFFQVESDERSPFRIQSEGANVEVLGTEFSVNTNMGPRREMVVAVTEGSVALHHELLPAGEDRVVLDVGEVGILDQHTGSRATIEVEHIGASNYLSWMNRRLQFQEMPLAKVCSQFYRIYSLECHFDEEEMKSLRLTTDISEFSLERTLTIMAMSLGLNYELKGETVYWQNQ